MDTTSELCLRSMKMDSGSEEFPPFQGGVARSAGAVGKVAKHLYRYPRSAPYSTTPALRATPPWKGGEFSPNIR